VCAGVADFAIDDELYCCPVFEDEVVPLLRTDADLSPSLFCETYREVLGIQADGTAWVHPPASRLLGWAKSAGRSPVVYLQPGDGPATFGHPQMRRLVGNALAWVASPEAHRWAAARETPVDTALP
jgi:hypothetical protein